MIDEKSFFDHPVKNYKMIAIYLNKEQELDSDPKAIQ